MFSKKVLVMEIKPNAIMLKQSGESAPLSFPLPEKAFGDASAMAAVLHGYINENYKPKQLKLRLYVNTRQTTVRTASAPFPFEKETHVMHTDRLLRITTALPLSLADALTAMCATLGIRLHHIESLHAIEYALLKTYGASNLCLVLPQENGFRVLHTADGLLTGAFFISNDPSFRETELNRTRLSHPFLPNGVRFLADDVPSWLADYFSACAIPLSNERYILP